MQNNIGELTAPCLTPFVTRKPWDRESVHLTLQVWFLYICMRHLRDKTEIFLSNRSGNNLSQDTRSNVLDRSLAHINETPSPLSL